jgi:hypothetical protein
MDQSVAIDELLAEINRYLPPEQQIQKGDPMFAGVVLNRVVVSSHVRSIQKKLDEAVLQMRAASEQQTATAAAISENLIGRAGNQIERQVETAAKYWEERLRRSGVEGELSMRRACLLAWTGAILIFASACIVIGSHMGNFVFDQMHHPRQHR